MTPTPSQAPPPASTNVDVDYLPTRYARMFTLGSNPERLVFFSDAVFAIAMTLLVIDIKVPTDGNGAALDTIVEQAPALLAYVLSFGIIALNWTTHHRRFRAIARHDSGLLWLDLLLLLFVAFVPFPTSLLSEYGTQVAAVVLYAFVVGMLTVIQMIMWAYAWRHELLRTDVDAALYRYAYDGQIFVPIVFWASIPAAIFIDGALATYLWILLWPISVIGSVVRKRRSKISGR